MKTGRQKLLAELRSLGLVEMKPTGSWGLTREGEDFLDQLELLKELDERKRGALVRREEA